MPLELVPSLTSYADTVVQGGIAVTSRCLILWARLHWLGQELSVARAGALPRHVDPGLAFLNHQVISDMLVVLTGLQPGWFQFVTLLIGIPSFFSFVA